MRCPTERESPHIMDPSFGRNPMFSVVIPLFNKQDFIERAVDSVLRQTYADFELIVVDDGSTDSSLDRLLRFADARLRIIRQANAGKGPARNTGIRESSREWIALLDADDYWFPDHLSELARAISLYPNSGRVATSYLGGEDPSAVPPPQLESRVSEINYFRSAARHVGVVWSSAVALRKSVV